MACSKYELQNYGEPSQIMKNSFYYISLISLFALGCNQIDKKLDSQVNSNYKFNITQEFVSESNWMNEPQSLTIENNSLNITV